jgi:hypothetical protein
LPELGTVAGKQWRGHRELGDLDPEKSGGRNKMASRRETKRRSKEKPEGNGSFLSGIQEIRRRARQHMENGAVTEGYQADLETVLRVLNEVLATELVCVLRYKRHHYMARGIHSQSVAEVSVGEVCVAR